MWDGTDGRGAIRWELSESLPSYTDVESGGGRAISMGVDATFKRRQ